MVENCNPFYHFLSDFFGFMAFLRNDYLFLTKAVEIKESSSVFKIFEYNFCTCHNPLFLIFSIGLKFPSQLEVAEQSEQQETVPMRRAL